MQGVDQPAYRDPPLPEHVANFRLYALSNQSKILRAQPFSRTSNSPTLDQGVQGLRGGVSIIEITSVEEIMRKRLVCGGNTVVKSKGKTQMD
ncbi:hypothetical protein L3X38_025411 [Prunus dulcis]|uniref:Uncharacterized protein n=1 Tax=Prunus dulcis TaxID=3755 RepID=A0AAD4W2S6_PRUDU|nr:hypothetical protein L3X38_025411 [Prunus dulcis]